MAVLGRSGAFNSRAVADPSALREPAKPAARATPHVGGAFRLHSYRPFDILPMRSGRPGSTSGDLPYQ